MGKTTFLKGFAEGLGIKDPVASPTFALVAEYEMPTNKAGLHVFSHMDIFRVDGDSVLALPEINEKLDDPGVVLALEWADKFPHEALPERRIELKFYKGRDESSREVELNFIDPGIPDDTTIREILEECQTPIHIRKHIATVTKVSTHFGQKIADKGYPIDIKLVRSASLLHDAMRLCNFPRLEKDHFAEDITPEKWSKWEEQIQKYGNQSHSKVIADMLREKDYNTAADVIEQHGTMAILNDDPLVLEEKCLYLADRYSLHDQIASLEERLENSLNRNWGNKEVDKDELRHRVLKLEEEMCALAGLLPEEVFVLG
jgi:tRNA threonylcarbamoyladenosine biosynthesis protein TsaE